MLTRARKQGRWVLADVRRWQRAVAGIASTVRMGQDAEPKVRKLRALLDLALEDGAPRTFEEAPRARAAEPGEAAREIAAARVDARQRVLLHLARNADRFLNLHVVLEEDRKAARNELLELLFDASDLGAAEGVLRWLRGDGG